MNSSQEHTADQPAQECGKRALAGRTEGSFGYFKNQRKVFADCQQKEQNCHHLSICEYRRHFKGSLMYLYH